MIEPSASWPAPPAWPVRSASWLSSNPVHAALSLVGTLFGIAVLFVAQEANFLAAVQVIVYAGAIVVLFPFVIMLLGVDRTDNLRRGAGAAASGFDGRLVALGVLGLVLTTLASTGWGAEGVVGELDETVPDINQFGEALFTRLPVRLRDHIHPA